MCISLCYRLSAASHDPYNEDMRVELLPYDLQFQMFKILSIETEDEKGRPHNIPTWDFLKVGINANQRNFNII